MPLSTPELRQPCLRSIPLTKAGGGMLQFSANWLDARQRNGLPGRDRGLGLQLSGFGGFARSPPHVLSRPNGNPATLFRLP